MQGVSDIGSRTLLVVDDDRIVRLLASTILRQAGFAVVCAESGEEAVDIFRAEGNRIALVLLDVVLPGISGPEVCRELRCIRRDIPVVLSSGCSDVTEFGELIARGCETRFLEKPYDLGALVELVRELVANPHAAARTITLADDRPSISYRTPVAV